jgi:hypothetical protein
MTTQTIMKARIADEISRADLTTQIGYAITDAIGYYQPIRFYFNETDSAGLTFSTVATQEVYDVDDNATLPWVYDVDDVFVVVGENNYRLMRIEPSLYRLNQADASGQPYEYMWNKQQFSFNPVPDAVYSMIVTGHYKVAAPATDGEASNPWMVDAERMIRSAAKRILYQDIILDGEAAQACALAEDEAFWRLKSTTNKFTATGYVKAMQF